ncbi:5-(carboxyamino)imidazole ribonucleotide synthase [Corynebacterium sp. LD5P10]|uniref:N5-carboxyaminoimidazole ribonucleotide synthase n=2 Tax=Corynebacterium kalidii TaxID=2931982 RepID=A0A9X1WI23_9CORY|nr:5-(carboxyamino)imidazole ribonucleotide synthase [Corynebacterium kalidii]
MPLVTVIGDGQLARMMQQAGIELGLTVRLLAGSTGASAAQATADVWLGAYTDEGVVRGVAAGADAVTFDHEHVPNDYLEALIAEGVYVQPQPSALINAQDKLVMRRRMREIGAPVPPFLAVESVEDAAGFWDATDGAVCLKARRGGYDGKGVWFPATRDDLCALVADLLAEGVPLMAEKKVRLVRELSAMVARTPSGEVASWPVVESVQADGICYLAVAPAPAETEGRRRVVDQAYSLARQVADELGVTGVLAVELFETVDEAGQPEIIVNELAMRPHNTGHWTQDGCVTSQFEQHLRAVLDRPLGSTAPVSATTVMANVLGDDTADPEMPMPRRMDEVWRRFPTAKIHLYGKDWRPRRKIGHVNMSLPLGVEATAENVDALRRDARLASDFLVTARWTDA